MCPGAQYRPTHAVTNLMDDQQEDRFNSLSFDEGNLDEEASTDQPTTTFYAGFNKPSVREPLHLVPSGQRFPEYQNIPNLALFSRESNLVEPITFPLNQGNQIGLTPSKPALVKPQTNSFDAYSGPSGTGSAGMLMHFKPSHTSSLLSLLPPKVQSKQPAAPGSGEMAMTPVHYQQPNTVSSPSNSGSNEKLFGEVFNFNTGDAGSSSASDPTPQQNLPYYPSKPSQSYPSLDTGRWSSESNDVNRPSIGDWILQRKLPMRHFLNSAEPQRFGQRNSIDLGSSGYTTPWNTADEDWMFSFFPKVFDNMNVDFPHSSYQPQNSASVQMDKVSKVYQPARSLKPLKKRIVHSKNGYKRGRFVTSKTAYTPEYQMAPIKDTMVLKPIQRQPRKWPQNIKL